MGTRGGSRNFFKINKKRVMRLRTVQGNETNYLEEIKTKEVIHP